MSARKRQTMHVNSLLAYYQGEDRMFGTRELLVLGTVEKISPCTDREVMLHLGFKDMNAVRPRITELLEDGILVECDSVNDPITHRDVRRLKLADDPRKPTRSGQLLLPLAR